VRTTGTLGRSSGLLLIGTGNLAEDDQEEALMSEHFPAEYAAYRPQVAALVHTCSD